MYASLTAATHTGVVYFLTAVYAMMVAAVQVQQQAAGCLRPIQDLVSQLVILVSGTLTSFA